MSYKHYYFNHCVFFHYVIAIGKLIISLLVCIFFLYACQEVDEDLVWQIVSKCYPGCQKIKPKVVHVKKVKMVDGTETKGLYLPKLNLILLSKDADLDVLVLEYRHACGDSLGEISIAERNLRYLKWLLNLKAHCSA